MMMIFKACHPLIEKPLMFIVKSLQREVSSMRAKYLNARALVYFNHSIAESSIKQLPLPSLHLIMLLSTHAVYF